MSFVYRIEHTTRYDYAAPVATSQHVAYLIPRDLPRQRLRSRSLRIDPPVSRVARRRDYFGNHVEQFAIVRPHQSLEVRATSVVEVSEASRGQGAAEAEEGGRGAAWETVRDAFVYTKGVVLDRAAEYVFSSPYVAIEAETRDYAAPSFSAGRTLAGAALDLMHRIHREFRFDPEATTVTTPVSRVMAERRGVCQDLAHVMVACFRAFGIPARYVSGYLLTDPPPGSPRLLGVDASHAWVSYYSPNSGWTDLDPTNDVAADRRHVVLAWGRDYGDVCPLRGVFVGGGAHTLHVGVSVIPAETAEEHLGEATA